MSNEKIKAIIVTVSDTRHKDDDISGVTLVGLLISIGAEIVDKVIITDDLEKLEHFLHGLTERNDINLVLTTGGTGFGTRDNTPEATRSVIEREAPGISEAMRYQTLQQTPFAMLSRGVSGIRKKTLIINLPGSPKAVTECFDVIKPILPHAINLISGKTEHTQGEEI
jgi:molybdenum cofactor synthesis domain-containing protein